MSGITDPYKLYRHIHPSEVGMCVGSCMGGNRREEKKVMVYLSHLNFINTTAGWISLTSSSGPVKIPVSVCATTLQSVEVACDIIIFNKAKTMIAGGFDDISEEGSSEFANVKATSNAETEFAMGRERTEMLRPTTTTRTGFSSRPLVFLGCRTARSALLNGVPLVVADAAVVEKIGIFVDAGCVGWSGQYLGTSGIMQRVLHNHRAVGFLLDILQTWHPGLSRNYKTEDASNFQKEP
ncbi:hypothetical protein BKA83DRAFT_4128573 [Pisolithus microcarpus]|nr:hypothetical protein BKA83DRAFT_4128568 [Pisolithus microcarpus]KAI6016845.1 hypothetical protein BKA83DRAFT_4128573 [Pisolithus microcarpus]